MKRLLLLVIFVLAGDLLRGAEINVYAAASLSDVFKEMAPLFKASSGHTLVFNFGASGALARQIREGAPADVFFSADELRADQLEKAGLLLPGTRRTFLLNSLVVVVSRESRTVVGLDDLTKAEVARIAIGEPATVPVGTYTKEYLQKSGHWNKVVDKLIPLDTVRTVLAAVEAGNADAGFVYKTDALIARKTKIALEISLPEGPRIACPGAVLRDSSQPDAAKAFLEWLRRPESSALFEKYGFVVAP